jgi:membrane-associated phospholipid phosphatase
LGFATAEAQTSATLENSDAEAGKWKTWVLSSGSQFRLPPPPDEVATRVELERLRGMIASRDPAARDRIIWWDTVAPPYRWNQIVLEESIKAGLNANFASRRLALLHIALADAMIATWDSKYAHSRSRPSGMDRTLPTVVPLPATPSYPDEHAAAAATAAAVLSDMFPQRAAEFARLAEEAGRMRLLAGVAFPSDVEAGADLGRRVAQAVIERGRQDRSEQAWTGKVPTGPGYWTGTNPVVPQAATWATWLLTSPDEFRLPPPPPHGSPEFAAEMAQVKAYQRTPRSNALGLFWEVAVGGLRNFEYWNQHTSRLLLEYGQATNAPRAARTYALLNAAFYDAGVACWDSKYTYWTIRPVQLDPEFKTVVPTPNHPSYPSAHVCYSMTSALVLAHLFPRDASALMALGRESGDSRIWAGIHYPMDITSGQQLAERVAGRAIERAKSDGADNGIRP